MLKKANHPLEKTNRLSDQLRKSKAAGYHPTRGRSSIKSAAECTKRHQHNLKRRWANSCSDSLLWLGLEGYTPTRYCAEYSYRSSGTDSTGSCWSWWPSVHFEWWRLNMVLYIKDRYMSGMFTYNHSTCNLLAVFSPAYLRHVGPTSLQHRFSLIWKKKGMFMRCFYTGSTYHEMAQLFQYIICLIITSWKDK